MSPRPRAPPALLVLLAVSIAAGAAASLLAAAPERFVPSTSHTFSGQLPAWAYGVIALSPFLLCVASLILNRSRGRPGPSGAYAALVVVGLLFLAFVVLSVVDGHVGGGVSWLSSSSNPSTNQSSPPPGTNHTTCANSPCPTTPGTTIAGLPGWLPLVAISIVGLACVAFVVPALAARRGPAGLLPSETEAPNRLRARAALSDAAAQLLGTSDPRAVIVELYLRLLGQVAPMAGDLDTATAGEIRDSHLLPLGVRRDAAEQLTRLFEEARYSTHPMGPEASHRALDAIRAAESDLRRLSRVR